MSSYLAFHCALSSIWLVYGLSIIMRIGSSCGACELVPTSVLIVDLTVVQFFALDFGFGLLASVIHDNSFEWSVNYHATWLLSCGSCWLFSCDACELVPMSV